MNWQEIKEFALAKLDSNTITEGYLDRLRFEISEIEKQGAEAYWIKVAESGQKGLKNPNRLLIAYLLGVSDEDPLSSRSTPMLNSVTASKVMEYNSKYGFLPEDIIKDTDMPDIDIDCLPHSRDHLKEYAIKKYGSHIDDAYGSVCSVGTWQTYKLKSAIIDCASALNMMSRFDAERFTTEMPDEVDELKEGGYAICKGRVIKDGVEDECGCVHDQKYCPQCNSMDTDAPTIGRLLEDVPQLAELHKKYPSVDGYTQSLVDYSKQLVGRIRNQGMHAGALIITDRPLFGNIPLAKSGQKGYWQSMWTEGRNTQLSKFGFVKWDLLGLKTLQYLVEACKLIQENRGISFGDNMEGLEYNDPENRILGFYYDDKNVKHFMHMDDEYALHLANEALTDGVFQFDTDLAKQILSNGVKTFEDLMLLNAMGHPGPMQSIPEAVSNRDDKTSKWKKRLHQDFLEVLESTYGVIVYQEQLQAIWQKMANFTSPEAQEARKAVAKKWTHKLKPIKQKWLNDAGKKIGKVAAEEWWERMETFGRYAFNKSHSVSYCLIAMRCLWFKAHFAPEFWAAIMSDCHPKKLPRYMGVARSENWLPTSITYCARKPDGGVDSLKFSTIDINNLKMNFSVSGNCVNQGMIGIKGIGEKAALLYEGTGNYSSLDQFVEGRTNKSVIERFIKLGAFLHLPGHHNSNALWHYYQYHYTSCGTDFKRQINKELLLIEGWDDAAIKKEKERQISEYKRIYPKRNKIPPAIINWKPKVIGSLDSFNKIIQEDFTLQERLAFQKEYIGYFIDSPMSAYRVTGDNTFSAAREKFLKGEEEVYVNVILEKVDVATTKTGKPFAKLMCNDGITETLVFMWANELRSQDENNMIPGIGVNIMVDWDEKKNLFCVKRGHRLYKLKKR